MVSRGFFMSTKTRGLFVPPTTSLMVFLITFFLSSEPIHGMFFYTKVKELTNSFIQKLATLEELAHHELEHSMYIEALNDYITTIKDRFIEELKEAKAGRIDNIEDLMTQFIQELRELGINNISTLNNNEEKMLANIINTMTSDILTVIVLMMGYMNIPNIVPNGEKVECTTAIMWVKREELYTRLKCLVVKQHNYINTLTIKLETSENKVREAIYNVIAKRNLASIKKTIEASIKVFGRALTADALELYMAQLYTLHAASEVNSRRSLEKYGQEEAEINKMSAIQERIKESAELQLKLCLELFRCPEIAEQLTLITPQERRGGCKVLQPEDIIKFYYALLQGRLFSRL